MLLQQKAARRDMPVGETLKHMARDHYKFAFATTCDSLLLFLVYGFTGIVGKYHRVYDQFAEVYSASDMRFHVLGLGSVGTLFSLHLRKALAPKHCISLIHKTRAQANEVLAKGRQTRVEHNGVIFTASGYDAEIFEASQLDKYHPERLLSKFRDPSEAEEKRLKALPNIPDTTIESLIVTTKAHQTLPAIRRLFPRISRHSTIMLLQNGMGVYEQLIQELFRNPEQRPHFILASNTHGVYKRGLMDVVHTGKGAIEFGIAPDPGSRSFEKVYWDKNTPEFERKLSLDDITSPNDTSYERYRTLYETVAVLSNMHDLNASWKPLSHIQTAMRKKLTVNAVINPLTAVMGCRNGEIFSTIASRRLMGRICAEAAAVFARQIKAEAQAWLDTIPDGPEKDQLPLGRVPLGLSKEALEAECLHVAELTCGNISSMLSDVRHGRQTEIEFINGYLLALGTAYNVQMPATATLLNLVKMRSAIPIDQRL